MLPRRGAAQTAGCGRTAHPGETVPFPKPFAGYNLTHFLSLPATYNNSAPAPLLLFFHGWGAGAGSCGPLCDAVAPKAGFVVL